jgi:hypothetical protein
VVLLLPGLPALGHQVLELGKVQLAGRDDQQVPAGAGQYPVAAGPGLGQQAAQRDHMGAQVGH